MMGSEKAIGNRQSAIVRSIIDCRLPNTDCHL